MIIYAFSGKQKVGKNYVAEKLFIPLLENKNTMVMAFADHFKVDAIVKNNLPYDKAFGEKDVKTRKILQKLGTEEGRDKYGEDIWIKILDTWIRIYEERGIERVIITDLRFKNEYEYLKSKKAIIIKIEAHNRQILNLNTSNKEILNHKSETELNELPYDYLINNNYNNNIINDLKKIINDLKKIIPS